MLNAGISRYVDCLLIAFLASTTSLSRSSAAKMNHFSSKKLALFLGVVPLVSAYLIEPPTTAASNTIQDCSAWHVAAMGDVCTKITDDNWITVEQFQSYVSC